MDGVLLDSEELYLQMILKIKVGIIYITHIFAKQAEIDYAS